ncbi:rCG24011 [Rattus norvegicus]|uniref:RCG24011 n=1 Tax=Rattus norvegicus TaxID=10116 RepID=A6JW60_RAT|nr:rCG24011 [Rattus norvegicus]
MPAYTRDTRNEGENYQFSSHDGTRAVSRKSRLDYSQPLVLKNFTQLCGTRISDTIKGTDQGIGGMQREES